MDKALARRAIVIGHLALTAPAIAAILLVPFFGLRMLGPFLLVYYVLAGVAFGWQWHSLALPAWTRWVVRNDVSDEQALQLAHRAGLAWLGENRVGLFALHTTAAAVCGIHLGPWLLSRWSIWVLPLFGITLPLTGSDYLQHFELVSLAPAFVVGYFIYPRFPRLATWAWVVPTVVLLYKMLTFTEPYSSVLVPHTSTLLSYFFVIQPRMPTLTPDFGGVDVVRVETQLIMVAPFYAGVAYSIGALVAKHNLVKKKFFGRSPGMQQETEIAQTEKIG